MTGWRPTAVPARRGSEPFGSARQPLEGQNTLGPSRAMSAGISVSAATSMTATAMAMLGPMVLRKPSEDSVSALNAMMTAAAAEAMTSPMRAVAVMTACLGWSPARSRSR